MEPLLNLREYEPRRAVPLSVRQRDQLAALNTGISVSPSLGFTDRYDLTPGSQVGVVHLEGLDIVIQPKIPFSRLLFLLSYVLPRVRDLGPLVQLPEAPDLPEAIVAAFVRHSQHALSRGVQQDYREFDDSGLTLRGRLRIGDQVRRRFGPLPPVEVTYDDFTVDHDLNRVLKAATNRLLRLRLRSDASRRGLRGIDARLEGVRLVHYDPRRLPSVRFTRLNERYRPAHALAALILRSMSFDVGAGPVPATAFLVDMNRAFEEFLVAALREAISPDDGLLVQGSRGRRLFLDERESVQLLPDLSLWRDGRCLWVGDAKYKKVAVDAYPNADIYQATAYAIATGLGQVDLIYAKGERDPELIDIVHLGKRVRVIALDLSLTPEAILSQVEEIANSVVAGIRAVSPAA